MAPKKRPHGKGVATSSSTPPHFDRRRFWNAEAENICTSLIGKSMHRERGVDSSIEGFPFTIRARQRQWMNFVQHPGPAVKTLVREFYANLKVHHEEYKVWVRGKKVAFDSETINMIYDMPSYEVDGYRTLMAGTVDYVAIMRSLCVPGAVWKLNLEGNVVNFESKFLNHEAYQWFVFITARLMPSNHTSEVTKERAALLYCIMRGHDIDAGRLVQSSILHSVRGSSTLSMPHTSLITELCRHAGVTWDDNEELLPSRGKIDVTGHTRDRRGRVGPASQMPQLPALPEPIAQPQQQEHTIDERITAIERSLEQQRQEFEAHRRQAEEHWQYSREHMIYMQQFNSALSQRFPTSSADYMPFPQPPTWSSQSRDVPDDDDIDMGPGGGNEY